MRHKKAAAFIIAVISVSVICSSAFAHSGRTDENGGHYDYSTGEYHYHNGGSEKYYAEDSDCSESDEYEERIKRAYELAEIYRRREANQPKTESNIGKTRSEIIDNEANKKVKEYNERKQELALEKEEYYGEGYEDGKNAGIEEGYLKGYKAGNAAGVNIAPPWCIWVIAALFAAVLILIVYAAKLKRKSHGNK